MLNAKVPLQSLVQSIVPGDLFVCNLQTAALMKVGRVKRGTLFSEQDSKISRDKEDPLSQRDIKNAARGKREARALGKPSEVRALKG
jgi:hypothetical protein